MADSGPSRLAGGDARRATVGDSIQISNILNILMDLSASVSPQRTFCVLATLIKETHNTLGIVPPHCTFCAPRTYIEETDRTLEIVSLQRTFCVLGMYMRETFKPSDIVIAQRTSCVLGFKNNKFMENSGSSHLNVRFVF